MRGLGVAVPFPPSPGAAGIGAMRESWVGAGLAAVDTHTITVHRTFGDFDDYWATIHGGPSVGSQLAGMTPETLSVLKARMLPLLPSDADGQITYSARANAVKGQVPH